MIAVGILKKDLSNLWGGGALFRFRLMKKNEKCGKIRKLVQNKLVLLPSNLEGTCCIYFCFVDLGSSVLCTHY